MSEELELIDPNETKRIKLDSNEDVCLVKSTSSANGDNQKNSPTNSSEVDNDLEKKNGENDKKQQSDAIKKVHLDDNRWFTKECEGSVEELRKSWDCADDKADDGLCLYKKPFRHGEIENFVKNLDFVQDFAKLFSKLEFHEKASDLFQFNQSDDLSYLVEPHVFAINEYLMTKVLPFLKKITGLPLNETISMFLSIYKQTDFLLCHDDELESRRIAFIWYLSEEWSEDYGGTLDLFSSTDLLHPDVVVKKIVPEYNKFVFFEVGATSYHQVSEVLKEGKSRLALSGWFYGEPLVRPKIEFPLDESYNVLQSSLNGEGILKKFIAEMYHNTDVYSEINEQLAEDSEVLVPGLFRDDVYASICQSIVDTDLSETESPTGFRLHGPPNLSHYKEAIAGPPVPNYTGSSDFTIESLLEFFYSKEFLNFMEQITEFPFTSNTTNRVVSSLQKYSHGCYSLMRTGGAKQTGSKSTSDEDVNEDEEEPNFVDVMFYFSNKWREEQGGSTIYSTTDGEQLITVPPEGNCLAVVVRSSTVNAYTNYVNCLAKDDVFFVYKMTFAFDGNLYK